MAIKYYDRHRARETRLDEKIPIQAFPSPIGNINLMVLGAFVPTTGAGATSTIAGGGFLHDFQLLGTLTSEVILENVSAHVAGGSFNLLEFGFMDFWSPLSRFVIEKVERAFDGRPAFRRASLVVNLLNIIKVRDNDDVAAVRIVT
ncbi:hypothetical protein EYC80_009057 [Monilinia laxa]|uniref:Uncharacterized protein n=1 Tax=Monilinia laxa TaxID=61186 RepID=A0A5N6K2M0_MONLA|nr:hypothetical protein EYC80_009057 [Monilinia laxa]